MANYTLTGASDWPMLVFMLGGVAFLLGLIQILFGVLIRNYNKSLIEKIDENHKSVMGRISTQRKEDFKRCEDCREDQDANKHDFRSSVNREFDALWQNVRACCAAVGVAPLTKKDIGINR